MARAISERLAQRRPSWMNPLSATSTRVTHALPFARQHRAGGQYFFAAGAAAAQHPAQSGIRTSEGFALKAPGDETPEERHRAEPWRLPPVPRSEEHTTELQSLMRISYA